MEGKAMKSRCSSRFSFFLLLTGFLASSLHAEPVPLKRAVELALSHATAGAAAAADEQRALASYHEARNQYLPQLVVGSGLGASWGFPLSLEGSAPSLLNVNSQSALFNPALRDFVRAARSEWSASKLQTKDQRNQVIQDTVLAYVELDKWQALLAHLQQDEADARKMEELVEARIQEGVDSKLEQSKARLNTARARLRVAQARGSMDILRTRLSQLTGVPAATFETVKDSIPTLPEIQQSDDLSSKAVQSSPAVQAATTKEQAQVFRARGEHRALLPTVDFAAQYALLSRYNNYDEFYNAFQRHNATVGVALRFPFLNFSQRARAQAADAQVVRAKKDSEAARNQVSEETLRLQRSVEQLAAAREVADLENQVAQATLDTVKVQMDSGNSTVHDLGNARLQANERFTTLQDAEFELEKARILLLRATGGLEDWATGSR
jgi:outer membrane protein TolC